MAETNLNILENDELRDNPKSNSASERSRKSGQEVTIIINARNIFRGQAFNVEGHLVLTERKHCTFCEGLVVLNNKDLPLFH